MARLSVLVSLLRNIDTKRLPVKPVRSFLNRVHAIRVTRGESIHDEEV